MSAILEQLTNETDEQLNRLDEDQDLAAPVHQDRLFLIMWQSSKSGGTYSMLRKSVQGKNNFLRGLSFMGVNLDEVIVVEQTKAWVPEKKKKPAPLRNMNSTRRKSHTWKH